MQEGSQFGPYQILKRIAYGGMAEIHLAKTTGIGGFEKLLALKVIHPKFSEDQEFIDMLIDEAKIAVQLSHVNVGQIFDLGRIDDTYYIAMEFIDGKDLYQLLVRCSELDIDIPFDVIAYIGLETAAGLQYAHTKSDNYGRPLNLIHRDISPQNILISYDGEVKIVDFGIAKASQRSRETESGVIKGKFFYMSPEQAWGDQIDARTDIFSTGICLYEMITGEMLYNEEKALVLLDRVRKAEIPPMRKKRSDLPPALEQVVLKALAREREHRYPSAGALQGALSGFLYGNWPSFSRRRVAEFMLQVFGDQRFVLPLPPTRDEDKSGLMAVADFDPMAGKSVIFDLRSLDQTPAASPQAQRAPAPRAPAPAPPAVADFDDEDRTVAGVVEAQPLPGAVAAHLDDDEEEEERTITEAVWAAAGGDLLPAVEEEDEDRTAVIDMDAVRMATEEPADTPVPPEPEQPTSLFSRSGAQPERLNRPVQPAAGPSAPPRPVSAPPKPPPPQPAAPAGPTPFAPPAPAPRPAPAAAPQPAAAAPARRPTPRVRPNRGDEAGRPTLHVGSALKPARPNPLRRLFTPTGITVLGLLALLTFAGIKFVPTLLAEAQPTKATLVIESVPPGAEVALDGQSTGQQTEARIEGLLAGSTHKVSLTLAGYEPRTETVEITPEELKQGDEIRRRIFLHKARGRLKITSDPIRAEVYLNGKYIGDTPLDRDGLDREKNEIQLLLRKEGFRETREVLTWGEETVIEHHFAMTPRGG